MPNNILYESQSVDYGTLPQDMNDMMDRVHQTATNFNNRVDELFPGIKIKQEQERIRQEEKEKKDNLPWYAKLGYAAMTSPMTPGDVPSVSPYASERWMVGDKEGAQSMQKTQDAIGSVAAGLSLLGPYGVADFAQTAGTYGLGSALAAEGLSWGTGTAGYYGFNKLGQYIDNKKGTNITPYLSFFGGLGTGVAGYRAGLKTAAGLAKSAVNHGIRGYSDFKPALSDMIIDYTKPKNLGSVSFSPSELHTRFFNTRGSESGMNTYFKTAKYAGNTGSYNGRTVPSWQLPKADRFINEHNPINISLVNRSDSFIPVEDGKFIFDSPEKAGKLATLHFTQHTPVTAHGSGDWSGMSTTLMLPYGNVRKAVAPLNIEVMDTFFPNYNGLQIKTDGAKALTADKRVFDYYTKHGVDVEFSDRLAKLRRKYRIASKMRSSYNKAHSYQWDEQSGILESKQDNIGNKMQKINEQWTADNRLPVNIDEMRRLEKIENMKSLVTPLSGNRSPIEEALGFNYHDTPPTHFWLTLSRPGDDVYESASPYIKKYIDWINAHQADYRTITE